MVSRIVQSIKHLHTSEFVPFRRSISSNCHSGLISGNRSSNSLSRFYELVSVALYGGVRTYSRRVINNDGLSVLVKPDITDSGMVREVKGNNKDHEPLLLDFQMEGYDRILREESQTSGVFEIYRHSKEKIKSFEGTEEELFRVLSKSTMYGLRVPFSVAFSLWKSRIDSGRAAVGRYEKRTDIKGKVFGSCTRVRRRTVSNILVDPQGFLEDLGFAPKDFDFCRYMSPKNFYFGRVRISQFPIIDILER